jgi:hypothetical protein
MIRDQHHPLWIKDFNGPGLFELLNGNGSRNIISQGNIHFGIYKLPDT